MSILGRVNTHKVETETCDIVRKRINEFKGITALYRDLGGRDYGIDAVVEIFDCNGDPTGKFALLQIKGTEKKINPLAKKPVVSCSISTSNAKYAQQKRIPVILIYLTLDKAGGFYFGELSALMTEENRRKLDQDSITIHLPQQNNVQDDLTALFSSIEDFYAPS